MLPRIQIRQKMLLPAARIRGMPKRRTTSVYRVRAPRRAKQAYGRPRQQFRQRSILRRDVSNNAHITRAKMPMIRQPFSSLHAMTKRHMGRVQRCAYLQPWRGYALSLSQLRPLRVLLLICRRSEARRLAPPEGYNISRKMSDEI